MKKKFTILLAVLMVISILPMAAVPVDAASGGNVIVSVPWGKVNTCGHQQYSGPCQAYCWAYCRIILDNAPHTYRDYWTGSQAVAPSAAGYISQSLNMKSKQILLETICNNVDLGRPVVVGVNGTPGYAHFVVAIGYRASCDRSHLSENDILILDPASSSIDAANGANETYSYLSSYTLTYITASSNYVCWITTTGGVGTTTNGSDTTGRTSAPSVTVDGQTVNISWSYSGSTSTIDVYLLQSPWRWEDIRYHKSTTSNTCTFHNVAPGSYQAFTIVRPNTDYVQSEWTKFTVNNSHTTHAWNNGVVAKEPTLTSTGVRRYTCTLCGATRDEEIPAKDTISGRWSDTAGWTFSASTGTLTVSGTGEFDLYGLGKENEPSVKRIVVNEGITSLRMSAFSGLSNVVSVELPQSLTTIESTAFTRCTSLKEITIPSNTSDVRVNAFQECTALQNIYVDSQNAWYRSVDGVLFTKDMKTLLCFPYSRSGSYQVPDGVTELDFCSFSWCGKLNIVTIPESVVKINNSAFCGKKYDMWDTSTFSGVVRVYKGSYGETYVKSKAEDGLKYEIIDKCANGHTWDNGRVTTEATTTSPGVRTYTCTVCKATRTETIPALPAPTSGGLQNFVDSHTYYNGLFRDVAADAWYSGNVAAVYRLGLMKGTEANTFAPGKNVTIAETVTIAARLHSIYHTGKEAFDAYDGGNWYDPYINYARNNGIISENYNFDLPATQETFAHILAQALPSSVLQPTRAESIHFADAGRIVHAGDVELLCKAGVINGVQSGGATNFLPQNTITRAEASAIITRMAKPDLRIK